MRAGDALAIAAGFGLLFGFGEYVAWQVRYRVDGLFLHWSNPDTVWAAPLVLMIIAVAAVTPLALIGMRDKRGVSVDAVIVGIGALTLFAFIRSLRTGLHPLAAAVVSAGVMVAARGWLARHMPTGPRGRRAVAAAAAVFVLLGTGMTASRTVGERSDIDNLPPAPAGAVNVVFIILDTVRAESLGLYGYARPTTPRIERIAARGVMFERAISNAPWTLPSHASLFTGALPWQHRADWRTPLDERFTTIADYLSRHGYVTAGFTGNLTYTTRRSGLARGFIHYDDYGFDPRSLLRSEWWGARLADALAAVRITGLERKPAGEVRADALDWLARVDRPFFAFLNFFDAHAPYAGCDARADAVLQQPVDERIPDHSGRWTERRPRQIAERDRYDTSIACIDDEIGRFVDGLDVAGQLDQTLLVITADHGEHFGEHELIDHGNSLFDELLHVPLVVSGPGIEPGGRVTATAGLNDLPATIAAYLGFEEDNPFEGRSLLEPIGPADSGAPGFVVSQVTPEIGTPAIGPLARGPAIALTWNGLRFTRLGDGTEALFDLRADAHETTNVLGTPELATAAGFLRQQADRILEATPPPPRDSS